MKIKPLTSHTAPCYPTIRQIQQAPEYLQSPPPTTWGRRPSLAALMGTGILARVLLAPPHLAQGQEPDATPVAAGLANPADALASTPQAPMEDAQMAPTLTIAPLLAEAIERDGKGATGCIAVSPPIFLAEDEALDLISEELKSAGLELDYGIALAEILDLSTPAPLAAKKEITDADLLASNPDGLDAVRLDQPLPVGSIDLGDKKRGIFIEYLSEADYNASELGRGHGTVQVYDFPKLIGHLSTKLKTSPPRQKALVALLFDPLISHRELKESESEPPKAYSKMSDAEHQQHWDQMKRRMQQLARERLREQVRYLAEYLRESGAIEKAP